MNKKLSIHHHLVGLVLIAVIPVVFFAAGLAAYLAQERVKVLENNLLGTTRALNVAVEEQIISVVSSLKILSEVEDFHPDSIQYLHTRLSRFVLNQPDWAYISIVDTDGVQIFNTARPFGSRLKRLKKKPFFQQMLKTRTTVISGYRPDEQVITVTVPVIKNGMIIYAIVGSVKLASFSSLLSSQKLPKNWTASVMDQDANIIAHSKSAEHFVGRKATPKLAEKILWEGAHVFNDVNKAGDDSFGATSQSKITGWTLVLKVPDDGNLFTYWKSISFILLGGALLLCSSILFALYMSRKISKPILALSHSAKALGQGLPLEEMETSLQEVIDVSEALKLAAEQRGQNEEKIKALYEEAQEAIKLRDTFLSVASHELKSPVTALKLQIQMLDKVIKNNEFIPRQHLEKPFTRFNNQVRRLMLLIDDLLDVTRISAGKMEYFPETFDLVPFIQDVVLELEGEAQKAGSLISVIGDETLVGFWDRDRLEQVMINLITNAIKYGNSNPISIMIDEIDSVAEIKVIDKGLGISAENQEKIFERYERVGDTRSVSGLGLGLWIVRKILEGLDGSISVTSKVGEGSVFSVKLPIVSQTEDDLKRLVALHSGQIKPEITIL